MALFTSIFLSNDESQEQEMNRALFQGFIHAAQEKGRSQHNQTLLRICCLIYESSLFRSKLTRLMNQEDKPKTVQEGSSKPISKPISKPASRPKSVNNWDKKSEEKSAPKLGVSKPISESEKSTQTFRPKTLSNEAQTVESRIEEERHTAKKQPIRDLDNTFRKIFQDHVDTHTHTTKFIRELHVNKKYRDLSPKSFEFHYTEALKTLFLDKVDYLSSEELIAYYDLMLKKARTLYVNYLKA